MRTLRIHVALLIVSALCAPNVQANWMTFSGGPVVSVGTWPFGSTLSGVSVATQSNVVNGIPNTGPVGLTPINIPNLSPDYFTTGLQPNSGPSVDMLGTPYNDSGDTYHVVIDFSGTTGGANPGTLPAGSVFAVIDLDIDENYHNVKAIDSALNPITTPWISGPTAYFDMDNPMLPQGFFPLNPPPTFNGPVSGAYDMLGISPNFDVGMWLFQTTQDIRAISFDMDKSGPVPPAAGGGGAGWAFYTPAANNIPEPSAIALVCGGFLSVGVAIRRRHRC
jgi:hypothetical protein